ncbi:MAG TPA: flagellar biosynthetic protein FliO [Jatrophihabitans sp.]|jgi:flagellar protein FliO/FliZ
MDSLALVGRLLLSLAFVLGVMWLIARRIRKSPGKVRNSKLIDVLGRQQLTRSSSVAVVRVLDKALIVGVTDGQVTVLGETDLAEVEAQLESVAPAKPLSLPSLRSPKAARTSRAASNSERASERPSGRPSGRPAPRPSPRPSSNAPAAKAPLAGSALSPATWRATVESIRDLTVRTR